VLLEFALAATLSDATPDYELVLQAHIVLHRSIETSPDDALTSQAVQPSDERKRIAQSPAHDSVPSRSTGKERNWQTCQA